MEDPGGDSWDKGLRLAFSKRSQPAISATWKMPDASATPLPEPGSGPTVKPAAEGTLMAESYKVVGEVGRGGIGIVLQARDVALGREVAVKVLQPRHQTNPAALARFTREAKISAQLQHPGIVPVYAAGQDDLDRPFIAMKLLKGSTLDELLSRRKNLGERRAHFIRIFEQVCQTMAYAHSRGVIHRDLKPGNVMVGAFGEVQIIDWGFARVMGAPAAGDEKKDLELLSAELTPDGSSALSVAGSPIGTPAYMAPEQALGDLQALDERTDVFCLGAILCEILTGAPPHASPSVREVMDEAARGDVRPAQERLERSQAEPELVTLAGECLRPAKGGRPRNAAAVAERVSGFLQASEDRLRKAELLALEERQKKKLVIAGGLALLLAAAAIGGTLWSNARKRAEVEHQAGLVLAEADGRAAREDWAAAEERALHAEAVLKGTEGAPELQALVASKLLEFRTRKADRAAMENLYDLRMHANSPPHEMDRRYADAFRAIRIDIDAMDPAEIGAKVRARGGATTELLILALDDWVMRFKTEAMREAREPRRRPPPPPDRPAPSEDREDDHQSPERRPKILRAALAADDHPWRTRLRRALLAGDHAELDALAASIEAEKPPAPALLLLGHSIHGGAEDEDKATSVLVRAYRIYPGDFWISFILADRMLALPGALDARRLELCERHARLAASLNPRNPHAFGMLAAALFARVRLHQDRPGDKAEAIQMLRSSASLDPGRYGELAKTLLRAHEGNDPAALDEVRRLAEDDRHPPMVRELLGSLPP